MNSRYYYSFDDSTPAMTPIACSMASDEYPLIVNCSGNFISSQPFVTDVACGREDYYIIYITDGNMDIFIDGKAVSVSAGDVIIFPPKYAYKYIFAGNHLSYLWVHFTGSYADRLLRECISNTLPCILATSSDNKIIGSFLKIFDIYDAVRPFQKQELACALENLIINTATAVKRVGSDRSLEASMRYIHSAYNSNIRIPELAKLENLSNSRYITLFKSRTGLTPTEYIVNLRINTACELLLTTGKSVKEVGAAVGYSDAHFFSRVFKKRTGVTPNTYREYIETKK